MTILDYVKALTRKDAWGNASTGQGTDCDRAKKAVPFQPKISEHDLERAYSGDDVAERIVKKLPNAAMEKGFDVLPSDHPAYDFLWDEYKRLDILTKIKEAWIWGRLYGDTVLIFDLDDGQDRSQPVKWDSIKSIRWAQILESRYYEVLEVGGDPNSEYYRKPEKIRLYSTTIAKSNESGGESDALATSTVIHCSRCIFFNGVELPFAAWEDNDYHHVSVLEHSWGHLQNYATVFDAVAELVPELRQLIYKMPGWAEMRTTNQGQAIEKRLQDLRSSKSVYKMLVTDSEESIESSEMTLSGVDAVMDKFARRLVQSSGMPHTIALGEGSQGNTSGRTETEEWAATVSQEQTTYLIPKLKWIERAIFAQIGAPQLDDGQCFEYHFPSIISESESDKTERYERVSKADQIYAMLGVISPQEMRSRFSQDGFKLQIQLDDDDEVEPMEPMEPNPVENIDADETFIPPAGVAEAAAKGLAMRSQFGRGGTMVGVARARDLSNQKPVSLSTIGRMVSFFARHEQNKGSETPAGEPGNGQIAWMLWGGDAGRDWAKGVWEKAKEKKDESEIQTLVFSKKVFKNPDQVKKWMRENGFDLTKPLDETTSSFRARQTSPDAFRAGTFRSFQITNGVIGVIGELA